jgi:hypothetical protein
MRRRGRKWSRGVRVRRGALGGWHDDQSASTRHRELRKVARRSGAGETSRRLNFLSNVANRSDNRRLQRVARQDQRWVAANLEEERRRGHSRPIRVRGSRRARRHRRRRARR